MGELRCSEGQPSPGKTLGFGEQTRSFKVTVNALQIRAALEETSIVTLLQACWKSSELPGPRRVGYPLEKQFVFPTPPLFGVTLQYMGVIESTCLFSVTSKKHSVSVQNVVSDGWEPGNTKPPCSLLHALLPMVKVAQRDAGRLLPSPHGAEQ